MKSVRGSFTNRGDTAPSYFDKVRQQVRDDDLIRENSLKVKEIFLKNVSLNSKKDISELADMLDGNKNLAHAIGRRKLGHSRFKSLMG